MNDAIPNTIGAVLDKPEAAETHNEILNKPEAAQCLRVKPRTLDEWMRRGMVPYSKLPSGTVRFRREQLVAFIRKYEVAS